MVIYTSIFDGLLCLAHATPHLGKGAEKNPVKSMVFYQTPLGLPPLQGNVRNIARGTMDPEIDSVTWTKLQRPHGTTCIICIFWLQMAPLASAAILTSRWRPLN